MNQREKPIPEAGPYDAIVKTNVALVCTSDSHTVHGAIGQRKDMTLGHEATGTVYKVGSHVKLFKPGDRVSVGAITPDWGDIASQVGYPSQSGGPLAVGNFLTVKTVCLQSIFTLTRRMLTWPGFLMRYPIMLRFTCLT